LKKSLNQDFESNGGVGSNVGNVDCGSNVDVNHLLSQMEELKLKVATNEERICLYEEQIMEFKKMLAKEEHQSQENSKVVVELRKKIAKQYTDIHIERKMIKVFRMHCSVPLGFIECYYHCIYNEIVF